jgi:beta-1,4-mannosyl-glycoprotein beta-1,4-N-acetylglucosaminyltransferase
MIYDCFLYHGTDTDRRLLALRLATLSDVVDRFVLVEATVTHAGNAKPLWYQERDRHDPAIAPYADRITAIGMSDLPDDATPLTRENVQRAGIQRGLEDAQADDWILVSDLDEIPRPDAVTAVIAQDTGDVYALGQRLSYYAANCVSDPPWFGTRLAKRGAFSTTQTIRHVASRQVSNAGWHLSYLGGVEDIQRKIAAYLHQEYATPAYTDPDHIARAIAEGRDLFDREGQSFHVIPVDETFPAPMLSHPDRYADWIAPMPLSDAASESAD